jgi:hypothetical protein
MRGAGAKGGTAGVMVGGSVGPMATPSLKGGPSQQGPTPPSQAHSDCRLPCKRDMIGP